MAPIREGTSHLSDDDHAQRFSPDRSVIFGEMMATHKRFRPDYLALGLVMTTNQGVRRDYLAVGLVS